MSKLISECESIAKDVGCEFKVQSADVITTFKGGGNACVFYPESEEKFIQLYGAISERICEPFILGGGSNTIIADGLCKVPIICTRKLSAVDSAQNKVSAGCGAYIRKVTDAFRKQGYGGFEFMSGVPATVGGAVRMNASAFNTQTAHYIDEIRILSVDCDDYARCCIKTLRREDLDIGYRKGVSDIIVGATFKADMIDADRSKELSKTYLAARAKKQPRFPSCGSVFKNGSIPSGKLIEDCGLKGVRRDGAQISEMHGNFIINTGGATADDFMWLLRLAEARVLDKYGIKLEREFVYLD